MNRMKSRSKRRRGASAVEFAIVAPIVFLVVLALMQFAGVLMSQNTITAAAREGARLVSMPASDSKKDIKDAVKQRLEIGGVDASLATITVRPNLSTVQAGDEVRVAVSAPLNRMGWIWAMTPPDSTLSAEISCVRE